MLATQVIKKFLMFNTHADLAAMYTSEMEAQVNVAKDGGKRIEQDYKGRQWHGWTDGTSVWKSFRIPYNANTEPEYTDREIRFDFDRHVEGIGMTGWNWVKRESKWVAFDFDSIAGHSSKHTRKVTPDDLKDVVDAASNIPWVSIRKSTSGKGLHLYVMLPPNTSTQNHTEHAALARSILAKMSALTGFDFDSRVDVCGGNMWVWHRKMAGTDGLVAIKQGCVLDSIPSNWHEHTAIVAGKRKRIVAGVKGDDVSSFNTLVSQTSSAELDAEHVRLINHIQSSGRTWWWDPEWRMLVTHTVTLKEAHDALGLRGIFRTISTGTDGPGDHNCFLFPLRNGAWAVRRYGVGTSEDSSWTQDGNGYTRTYYNRDLDLATASRCHNGVEDTDGGFVFSNTLDAVLAAELIGTHITGIPDWAEKNTVKLKLHKDGRLLVSIIPEKEDDLLEHGPKGARVVQRQIEGWVRDKKGPWKKLHNTSAVSSAVDQVSNYDDTIRHLVTEQGQDSGWVIKSDDTWCVEPMAHMKAVLESFDLSPKEVKNIIGTNVLNKWTVINRPFEPEYPGGRQWNRNSPQLKYLPNFDAEELSFPTWLKILNHTGRGLDDAVAGHKWCSENGILTGSDYLKVWIASLFQKPMEPLPYLFFYGPQGSGKTIFHEAIKLLVTQGVQGADKALTSQQGFNGELENAILCIVEETNLQKQKDAYDRIKAWVTGITITIHPKRQTPYDILNTTHWIQCANEASHGPSFQGDTRITMLYVEGFKDAGEVIPKRELIPLLEKEAPDFLAEILRLEIPVSPDRLNVPVIETEEKRSAELGNMSALGVFLKDHCYAVDGHMILFSDFYYAFLKSLDPFERNQWSKIKVGRQLPPHFPRGKCGMGGHMHVCNISFDPEAKPNGRMVIRNEKVQHIKANGDVITPIPLKPSYEISDTVDAERG